MVVGYWYIEGKCDRNSNFEQNIHISNTLMTWYVEISLKSQSLFELSYF